MHRAAREADGVSEFRHMSTSFAFILNPLELVDGDGPIEIMPDYFFQRADAKQIKVLKQALLKLPSSPFWLNSYEYDFGRSSETKSGRLFQEPIKLAQEDWKYWVIASNKGYGLDNRKRSIFYEIECALSVLNNDLELGPILHGSSGSPMEWNPRFIYNYFLDYPFGGRPTIQTTSKEIEEIGRNYSLFNDFFDKMYTIIIPVKGTESESAKINDNYQSNFQYIDQAIRRFLQLKALPRYSGLTVLGLFSIIESLITHKPRQNLHDSLKHQIKTKIPLLSRRFQRTLDYGRYFNSAKEETIWSKLYDYRSKVVHEGSEDIEKDKDLRILTNLVSVTDFLKETVKLLILLALEDPKFITDLKKV